MKVALITGASRGIGRAVALGLAKDGYSLALCARSEEDLEETRRRIVGRGEQTDEKVKLYVLDVTDGAAVESMVEDVVAEFGRIDLLFNNAGVFYKGTSELNIEDFSHMVETNLMAAFRMISLVAPVMKVQKSGTIINVSSRAGKNAWAFSGGYSATKFGLVGLNEGLYRELTEHGIKVTALCPGYVNTDMASSSGLAPAEMIQTEDILNTVRWLANLSPYAGVVDVTIETIRRKDAPQTAT